MIYFYEETNCVLVSEFPRPCPGSRRNTKFVVDSNYNDFGIFIGANNIYVDVDVADLGLCFW